MLASFLALDPKLLAALGGAASALLAALGYLAKVRHERKRSLRTVLYLLLQLRRQATVAELSLTEIPSGGVAALRRVLDELNLSVPAEFEQLLLLESMPALIATAEQLVHPERQEIRIALSKAIAELSRDSPILAYRLSSALPSAANSTLRDAVEGVLSAPRETAVVDHVSRVFNSQLHIEGIRSTKKALTSCILRSALHTGPLTFIGTLTALRSQNQFRPEQAFFDALMNPMRDVISSERKAFEELTLQLQPLSERATPSGA